MKYAKSKNELFLRDTDETTPEKVTKIMENLQLHDYSE